MSVPSDPAAPAARARPSIVTISSYLLMLFAVIQVIKLILGLSVLGKVQKVYRDAFAGTSAEGAESLATVVGIGAAVVSLLFAIGLIVLAVLNNRGKNAARIVTWVVGGIALCCTGLQFVSSVSSGSMGGRTNGNVPSQEEINRRLDAVLPSWYNPLNTTLVVVGLLALLAALILLALPASNQFFRRPQHVPEPPVPGMGYPGHPPSGTAGHPQPGTPGYSAEQGPVPGPGTPGERPGPPPPPPPPSGA